MGERERGRESEGEELGGGVETQLKYTVGRYRKVGTKYNLKTPGHAEKSTDR